MTSPVTNYRDPQTARRKLAVERVIIYQPKTEWTYSHSASITNHRGRYYAIWSNGRQHEDYPGQRVLISSSANFVEWTEPEPLANSRQGTHSELVLTAAGFHHHDDEMIAYFGQYEYAPEAIQEVIAIDRDHQDTSLYAMHTLNGRVWSEPQEVGLPIVPNHGPQPTSSGRLIISGHISYPYTDDPSGLSGWKMTGIYPSSMDDEIEDDSASFWRVQAMMGWPAGLCEGSFYETDDSVLHMLLRATGPGHAGKLWITESVDDGATWSAPVETNFTDNNTKFHLGRLPDGRFYYVGSPDPLPRGARSPLVLALSEDGVHFGGQMILADEEYVQRRPGLHKGGLYGYPHTMIHGGQLYVIVSLWKEAVAVMRVPLSAL